jgi:hypothetical protein
VIQCEVIAPAVLDNFGRVRWNGRGWVREPNWKWRVVVCPLCGGSHIHGGGGPEFLGDPRRFLGHKSAYCASAAGCLGYRLIDANPSQTSAMLYGAAAVDL